MGNGEGASVGLRLGSQLMEKMTTFDCINAALQRLSLLQSRGLEVSSEVALWAYSTHGNRSTQEEGDLSMTHQIVFSSSCLRR